MENLLESYFMQIDSAYDRLDAIGEYIEDTEEYINIELDSSRNRLLRLEIVLTAGTFGIAMFGLVAGAHPIPPWQGLGLILVLVLLLKWGNTLHSSFWEVLQKEQQWNDPMYCTHPPLCKLGKREGLPECTHILRGSWKA